MKIADFRIQTTAPDAPSSSSVVGVYANTSGVLITKDSDGTTWQVGARWADNLGFSTAGTVVTGIYTSASIFTGMVTRVYGTTGVGTVGFVMGVPAAWLPIKGPSGQLWAIPAYRYT